MKPRVLAKEWRKRKKEFAARKVNYQNFLRQKNNYLKRITAKINHLLLFYATLVLKMNTGFCDVLESMSSEWKHLDTANRDHTVHWLTPTRISCSRIIPKDQTSALGPVMGWMHVSDSSSTSTGPLHSISGAMYCGELGKDIQHISHVVVAEAKKKKKVVILMMMMMMMMTMTTMMMIMMMMTTAI